MSADKLCVDLCCGRKGFSRAFVDAGWEVVTVDIDAGFHPTVCVDLLGRDGYRLILEVIKVPIVDYAKVLVLASPPCTANSKANAMKWVNGMADGLRIAASCMDIIKAITNSRRETFFCIENPEGRLAWFLGKPNSAVRLKNYGAPTSKRTYLWHNLNFSMLLGDAPNDGKRHTQRRELHQAKVYDDSEKSADMSYLSQAIREAVEQPASVGGSA